MKILLIMAFSLIALSCNSNAQDIASNIENNKPSLQNQVVYKLFPTQNRWTFIKLNTRNGQMWQVQYSLEKEGEYEVALNTYPLISTKEEQNGRFILYPTQNMWTFILLDQINGQTWHVQWAQEPINRGVIPINPL